MKNILFKLLVCFFLILTSTSGVFAQTKPKHTAQKSSFKNFKKNKKQTKTNQSFNAKVQDKSANVKGIKPKIADKEKKKQEISLVKAEKEKKRKPIKKLEIDSVNTDLGKDLKNNKYKSSQNQNFCFNLKSQPAFFWSSWGLEAEFSFKDKYSVGINRKVSFGINIIGKVASLDGIEQIAKSRQDDYLQNGILAEIFFRYYLQIGDHFTYHSPTGFYAHSFLGASNIAYGDGNVRPFCMHNQLEASKGNQIQSLSSINSPKPFYGGLGFGYQFIILPNHIIGNFLISTQMNLSSNDKVLISLFVSPSVGWIF